MWLPPLPVPRSARAFGWFPEAGDSPERTPATVTIAGRGPPMTGGPLRCLAADGAWASGDAGLERRAGRPCRPLAKLVAWSRWCVYKGVGVGSSRDGESVSSSSIIPLICVTAIAAVAGVADVWRFRVPNILTIPALVAGVGYHGAVGGVVGLQASLGGALFGFGILFVLFLMGVMGAGDVKLMAAVGAWLGTPLTLYVFIVAGLSTGLYSVAVLVWNRELGRGIKTMYVLWFQFRSITSHLGPDERLETLAQGGDRRKRLIPFAAMVALAVLVLVAARHWLGSD
jgi:prepilin peptidase CpaA